MGTRLLKLDALALARLTFVPATLCGLRPGRSSGKPTCAPTAAGLTAPYMRTKPGRPAERRWRITRIATRSIIGGPLTVGVSIAVTRNWVFSRRFATGNVKPPAALVTSGLSVVLKPVK